MPRFLVLIYGDEQQWTAASDQWNEENGRRHRAFLEGAGTAVRAGGEVALSADAVSIRCVDGMPQTVTRGSLVEAPLGIGGFYLLEADDLDAAVELARGIPEASAHGSGVEVRAMPTAAG